MGEQPNWYRIAALKDFLPLSSEPALTPRQQSRSTTNLAAMRNLSFGPRRRSSFGSEDLPTRHIHESARDNDGLPEGQSQVLSSPGVAQGGEEFEHLRRMSSIPASLLTPQMRSQRLIGNSNPRYRWEQYWRTEKELEDMPKAIRK